jgi:hypothetical protein
MAGDWIKMRTDIYRDPRICVIADFLMAPDGELSEYVNQNCQRKMAVTRNVMRNVTVGALVTVWGVMRLRGKREGDDLIARYASLSVIDDVSELPGFGDAMASVGWAEETNEGIVFPRFFTDYNVDPNEDTKAKNAERQRKFREKIKTTEALKSNVTRSVTVTSQSNIEKRREEKSIIPPNPQGGMQEIELIPSEAKSLPANWQRMSEKDRKQTKVKSNSPDMVTIGAWFGRKSETLWTISEAVSLNKIDPTAAEVAGMGRYYTAEIPVDDYRRRDLQTLLNNWNSELDRARKFVTGQNS